MTSSQMERVLLEPYRLLGVPFEFGGRDKNALDCYGLTREIFHRRGVELADYPASANDHENESKFIEHLADNWHREQKPAPGYGVMFRIFGIGCHCGVMIDGDWFIHTMRRMCVARERLTTKGWEQRVIGYYRHTAAD